MSFFGPGVREINEYLAEFTFFKKNGDFFAGVAISDPDIFYMKPIHARDDLTDSLVVKIHPDKITLGFTNGHVDEKIAVTKPDFQFQWMLVFKQAAPVRSFLGVQETGMLVGDCIEWNESFLPMVSDI